MTSDWRELASCRSEDPELFFSETKEDRDKARRICSLCDVKNECLQYAREARERFGIWGGIDRTDRRQRKGGVPNNAFRSHGPDTKPHSCRRPECAEPNREYRRVWTAQMRKERRAAA
jgi:WhiB family redox-sensing transcriptional regulator